MFVTDAHCDTLWAHAVNAHPISGCMVTPDHLKKGGVGIQTFALYAGSKGMEGTPYEDGLKMLAALDDLGVPVYRGALPDLPPEEPHGVISIEGGEMIKGSIEKLEEFDRQARIRLIALTWNNENEIAFPASKGPEGGLKPFGIRLLARMDEMGIFADVSHLNEAGFWDVCCHAQLPPVASHSNCRWLRDVPRNLTREQVKAVVEREGFIGANFYTSFLTDNGRATTEDVFRHIDAICEMGGERVVGFGSDFDGIESWPDDLRNPADFPSLLRVMRDHGYSEETVRDIAGLNYWRLLKRAEAFRAKMENR